MLDLPPDLPEHIALLSSRGVQEAIKYEVPINILLAIAKKEGGKPR